MQPIQVVQAYFKAMQAGKSAGSRLLELFSDDATYIEPFSGAQQTHRGRSEIEAHFQAAWQNTPPEIELVVGRIDVDGERVRSEWTCTSPAFEAPIHGIDVCEIRGGKIARLEVSFA